MDPKEQHSHIIDVHLKKTNDRATNAFSIFHNISPNLISRLNRAVHGGGGLARGDLLPNRVDLLVELLAVLRVHDRLDLRAEHLQIEEGLTNKILTKITISITQ